MISQFCLHDNITDDVQLKPSDFSWCHLAVVDITGLADQTTVSYKVLHIMITVFCQLPLDSAYVHWVGRKLVVAGPVLKDRFPESAARLQAI